MPIRQTRRPWSRARQVRILCLLCILFQLAGGPAAAAPLAAPTLGINPQSGPASTTVTLSGNDYVPGGYNATVRWDGANQFTFLIPPGGAFQVQFTIPAQAAPGPHTVTVCALCGQFEFEQTASASFTVQAPATTPPPPEPPTIDSFTLEASAVTAGGCTNAHWTTRHGVSATLTGDFGTIPVGLNGSWQLCPPATQVYRLVVTGSPQAQPNSAAREITLIVNPAPTASATGTTAPTLTPSPTATFTPLPASATPPPASGPCTGVPAGATLVNFDAGSHQLLLVNYRSEPSSLEVLWDRALEIRRTETSAPPRSAPNLARAFEGDADVRPRTGYWTTVGLFLGLPSASPGVTTVTLRGYDATDTEVVSATAVLGPGAAPFDTCLRLAAPQIARVNMSVEGASNIFFDDFFFIGQPWPACPGSVAFTEPAGDTDLGVIESYTLRGTFAASARPLTFSLGGHFWDTREGASSSGGRLVVVPDPADPDRFTFDLTVAQVSVGSHERDYTASLRSPACANTPIAEAALTLRYRGEAEVAVQVQAVEVTQGLRGNIPTRGLASDLVMRPETWVHVANRTTVVRVYPWLVVRGGEVFGLPLSARLHGTRAGAPLPGSPLAPVRNPVAFEPGWSLADMRSNAAQSWNFELPASWTREGNIDLTIEVDPPEDEHYTCPSCAETRVTYLSGVRFRQLQERAVRVRIYLADQYWMEDGEVRHDAPNLFEIARAYNWWKQTWPVSNSAFRLQFRSIRLAQPECHEIDFVFFKIRRCMSSVPGVPMWDNAVIRHDSADLMPPEGVTDPYTFIPLLFSPDSPIGCSGRAGIGHPPLFHAGACGPTVAQEAAHSLGLQHAANAHGEAAGGGFDPGYPGMHGEIEPHAYGFDTLALRAIPPTGSGHTHDFMSYGSDPRWVSLYTWLALGREYGWDLTGRSAAPASGRGLAAAPWTSLNVQRQPEGEAPAVYGQIDPVNGLTLFGLPFRAQVLPETVTAAGSGYRVELRDTAGQVLAGVPFDARPITHAGAGTYEFHASLPALPGVASVVVMRDQDTLGGFMVSAQAPQVTLLEPAADAQWAASGEATVRWQGTDPDGDPLYYQVEMTQNGGQTWTVLASNLSPNELQVDLATLPATGEGWQIRVQASDGYHTAVAEAGPISVAPKGPQAIILEPLDGATWRPGQALNLAGQAFDWLEGDVPAEALAWLVDDEVVGQGEALTLAALALGEHQVTLRATNGQGLDGEHTITVHVAEDADADGLPDAWETAHGLDPQDGADAEGDADADVLPNWQEFALGTDPQAEDSDGDSHADADEVSRGSDPADAASVPYVPAAVPEPAVTVVAASASPVPVSQPTAAPSRGAGRTLAAVAALGACLVVGLLLAGGAAVWVLRRKK